MQEKPAHPSPTNHRFSFSSANGMLPLVKSIARDVFQLNTEIFETKERLAAINVSKTPSTRKSGNKEKKGTPYSKELEAIVASVDAKQERMEACLKELIDLNLRAPELGKPFVDFPALYDGNEVCLCWKIGEPKIAFWHLEDESCDKRRPVDMNLIPQPVKTELSGSL